MNIKILKTNHEFQISHTNVFKITREIFIKQKFNRLTFQKTTVVSKSVLTIHMIRHYTYNTNL